MQKIASHRLVLLSGGCACAIWSLSSRRDRVTYSQAGQLSSSLQQIGIVHFEDSRVLLRKGRISAISKHSRAEAAAL